LLLDLHPPESQNGEGLGTVASDPRNSTRIRSWNEALAKTISRKVSPWVLLNRENFPGFIPVFWGSQQHGRHPVGKAFLVGRGREDLTKWKVISG